MIYGRVFYASLSLLEATLKLVYERHAAWEADLPLGNDAALWDYLVVLDQGSRLALLAQCLSFGINALHEKVNPSLRSRASPAA